VLRDCRWARLAGMLLCRDVLRDCRWARLAGMLLCRDVPRDCRWARLAGMLLCRDVPRDCRWARLASLLLCCSPHNFSSHSCTKGEHILLIIRDTDLHMRTTPTFFCWNLLLIARHFPCTLFVLFVQAQYSCI